MSITSGEITDTVEPIQNRGLMTVSIMLATTMTTLDVTIANVALPRMAGSVSASPDQITWTLTSYIIAQAIFTPMTGWLTARLGRRNIFLISIVGFTITSAMCGGAQNLSQIVIARVLQGMFGASMMPLSQAVLIDIYPLRERGRAMSIWAMGSMVAPVIGPVIGGWLTDNFSWRWVFYINLPLGILALLGILAFLPPDNRRQKLRFDIPGFLFLSIAVAATQVLLDRGQDRGWFRSPEILIEAFVAAVAFLLFLIHSATTEHPFIPPALFKDRNWLAATLIGFSVSMLIFSIMAVLPTLMQTLLGYPVVTASFITGARGVGVICAMLVGGNLANRIDSGGCPYWPACWFWPLSFEAMSRFSLQMNDVPLLVTGLFMGVGSGLIVLPMSLIAFSTLDPALRADARRALTP